MAVFAGSRIPLGGEKNQPPEHGGDLRQSAAPHQAYRRPRRLRIYGKFRQIPISPRQEFRTTIPALLLRVKPSAFNSIPRFCPLHGGRRRSCFPKLQLSILAGCSAFGKTLGVTPTTVPARIV